MLSHLIEQYQLIPHPEGGYYKETYRSSETIDANDLPERFSGSRSFGTAIYFLLVKNYFSAFHRIQSDECWHFYEGAALNVHILYANGSYDCVRLGNKSEEGEVYQAIVPAGAWFASETTGEYSFVGCTVAPGFDFADFELGERDLLKKSYAEQGLLIDRLTRS